MSRRAFDPTLYLVTDAALLAGRDLVATVLAAVRGGVTMVQLRDKEASGRALLEQARALVAALAPLGVPLVVNDRVDIAHAAGAAGAHLGQSDLPAAAARAILGPAALIGLSIEQVEEIDAVDPQVVDHVAASPVFATATKGDIAPPLGLAGVRALRARTRLPIVAIGGIGVENAALVRAAGADGVAVVSAILAAADPRRAAERLREAMRASVREGVG
jgi:thiamine-phosphate pyrophosphorylase